MSQDRPALSVLPAPEWADAVTDALVSRIAQQPDLVLCLPTGSTPLPVYERLPRVLARRGVSMGLATIVLLDDYLGLPSGHPARCDSKLGEHLLDRLPGPPARFIAFGVDGADPVAACAAFDAEIDALGGLDLVVLGLGLNGHVGMNEPGTAANATTRVVDLAPSTIEAARGYGADPPPTRGVTLGLAGILAAREIWLLVSDDRKARILAATLHGPVTSDVPASLLRDHPGLRVIADQAAALAGAPQDDLRDTGRLARLDPATDGLPREELVDDHRGGTDDTGEAAKR